jgi:hypothetical protein
MLRSPSRATSSTRRNGKRERLNARNTEKKGENAPTEGIARSDPEEKTAAIAVMTAEVTAEVREEERREEVSAEGAVTTEENDE